MKFLADVNIPQSIITSLQNHGHDVLDSKKQHLTATDTELIALALKENRILLTRDKDFITLMQFPKYQVPTIAIRLKNQNPSHMQERLIELLENQDKNILKKSLTIIKEASAESYQYDL